MRERPVSPHANGMRRSEGRWADAHVPHHVHSGLNGQATDQQQRGNTHHNFATAPCCLTDAFLHCELKTAEKQKKEAGLNQSKSSKTTPNSSRRAKAGKQDAGGAGWDAW